MTARGIRNNNPGNIESGPPWQGLMERDAMTPEQRAESRFAVFVSPSYGIRAIARTLITYQDKRRARDGSAIDTVQEIIDRWAPPNENNTNAYAAQVRKALNLAMGEKISVHDYATMRALVEAIIRHENGAQPYDGAVIDKGLVLAGIEAPEKPLTNTGTTKASATVATGTAISAVGEVVADQADKIGETGRVLVDFAPIVGVALIVIGLGAVLYIQYRNRRRGLA